MNDAETIEQWQELQAICAGLGWWESLRHGTIYLTTGENAGNGEGVIAYNTKSVSNALAFVEGYKAGTKEDK